ncbi:hypothetical protein ACQ4PT_058719 [Festuca glaucescens]
MAEALQILPYVVAALADKDQGADAHLAALETLCGTLPYAYPDFLIAVDKVDCFVTRLPALVSATGADQGDMLVLAAQAIAGVVEHLPEWAEKFEKNGAVQALRDRLLAVDNMELAEQCLRLGVAAAVLQFFDFFPTNEQKVALKIVAKIVKECDGAEVPKAMEAAPVLCNLLQSSDNMIQKSALSCLGMIASNARGKEEHMDMLCELKVVDTAMRMLEKDGWKTIGDETLTGILGLLKNTSSASAKAVKSLFDLGVCDLLKQMITYYSSSHSNSDKMLVELINQLMRPLETSDTPKNAIVEQNAYLDQLAGIVPLLIQVAKCGALSSVCYTCIVLIGNIVELSTPTFLIELEKTANLSSAIFLGKLPGDVDESDPSYNLLFTLKILEGLNRFSYQLSMDEKIRLFAESCLRDLDDIKVTISPIPQHQFTSSLLTNKLELQMQDSLFEDGLVPSWCVYLVETCPFLFSFNARWKYFCLTLHHSFMGDDISDPDSPNEEDEASDAPNEAVNETEKYKVTRGNILESAIPMMAKHGSSTKTIEVVFEGEVGTGRGPTFEFYSTVSHELQRFGLGMSRGDNARKAGETGFVHSSFGLFPQPWSSAVTSSRGIEFSDVVQKFKLLGHIVARAILDGRILDISLSRAFYKIMLGQELHIYDIPSFDPELGKTVVQFQALIEDLCLDFTLPGNPEYELVPGGSDKMVTLDSLEEYVYLIVDATLKSGIATQIEAFKSAINEVFALKTLRMFNEEEMERILCGERDAWAVTFLEILREFGREEQRAFIQFSTGAPTLPLGGLASLDPKLTVV